MSPALAEAIEKMEKRKADKVRELQAQGKDTSGKDDRILGFGMSGVGIGSVGSFGLG